MTGDLHAFYALAARFMREFTVAMLLNARNANATVMLVSGVTVDHRT